MSTVFYTISSPLEQFEVVPLIFLNFMGSFQISLTNLALYTIITVFLVVSVHVVANNQYRLVPSRWSVAIEASYVTLANMVREQIGPRQEIYTPLVYSFFIFILILNLNGNIPYAYTVTTSGVAALGLSVFVFIAVTLLGLQLHKVHFFAFFVPSGTPLPLVPLLTLIELVSYFARALSLGVRLFSNMTAGHTLLKILALFLNKLFATSLLVAVITLLPFAVFVALIGLEIAVSLIQAYVFSVLLSSYLKDAIELH